MAEVEPPPNTLIKVICPSHGGPIPIAFRSFKPVDAPPPDAPVQEYPPKPLPSVKTRWWQFWRW
jgi:hypothetical protein